MNSQQQWLEWRRGGIGSSDSPIIMGVSPFRTKFQLWEEKVFGKNSQKENANMTYGKENEEKARKMFENTFHVIVFPRNIEHPDFPWIRASLDGLDIDEKTMVEIKCANKEDHALAYEGKVPEKYYPQCQHQMMVTGLDHMYYYSFHKDDGFAVQVFKDKKYIESLLIKERKFWDLRTKMIPPDLSPKDFHDMTGDEIWENLAQQWKIFKQESKKYEKRLDEVRKDMIDYACGKNCIGAGLTMIRSDVEGRMDMERLKEDHPEINWDSYRKMPTERFTIK